MSESKWSGMVWIKITTDVFDDESIKLIDAMPERDAILVIWFKLLCLAGANCGNGVMVFKDRVPYTDEMLSSIFHRPLNTIRLAMDTFIKFGMIERVDETYIIPSWEKYQASDKLDKRREADRLRKQRQRERQKMLVDTVSRDSHGTCHVMSRPQNKNKNKNKKKKEHTSKSDAFDEAWAKYPRKQGKQAAFKAYEKALNDGVSQAEILSGVERYAEWCSATGQDKRYIKHGSTWFSQRCWEDELPEPAEFEHSSSGLIGDAPSEGGEGWLNKVDLKAWGMQ